MPVIVHLPNDGWDQGLCGGWGRRRDVARMLTATQPRPSDIAGASPRGGATGWTTGDRVNDQAGGGWKMEGLCPTGRAAGSSGRRRGGDATAGARTDRRARPTDRGRRSSASPSRRARGRCSSSRGPNTAGAPGDRAGRCRPRAVADAPP